MEDIINSHSGRGVWGISYGAWDPKEWESSAYKIGLKTTEESFNYYWKLYANRPIDDIKEQLICIFMTSWTIKIQRIYVYNICRILRNGRSILETAKCFLVGL